jgi:Ca-activated chloride channel homolog
MISNLKQYCFYLTFILSSITFAQNKVKDYIIEGNNYYNKGNFNAAEYAYKRAALEDPTSVKANYNLGNALFQQKRFKESLTHYKRSAEIAKTKPEKHAAYHNAGNAYLEEKDYKNAVENFKNALKNNPYDDNTRYNLAYAKKMLEKQQEKENKQQQNSSDQKDQKDNNQEKQKQDKQKEQEKNNQQQKNQNNKQQNSSADKDQRENEGGNPKNGGQNGNQKGQGNQNSPEIKQGNQGNSEQNNAPSGVGEGLLKALQEQEVRTQRKIIQQKAEKQRTQTSKDW